MRRSLRHAMLGCFLAGGCAAPIAGPEPEDAVRARLQAAHDATLRLDLHGRLDAAAIARGVREVRAWCDWSGFDVPGSVDAHGTLAIAMPTIEAHNRCLTVVHVIDRAGAHWYCWFDLSQAPPSGLHDLGALQLQREPDAILVVDDAGQPVVGARVLLRQQHPEEHPGLTGSRVFETCTDDRGCARLCAAAPFDAKIPTAVRHEAFALWCGQLTSRVVLDHGGEIRGRVVLPAGVDPTDFAVGAWVDDASLFKTQGDAVYANVVTPLAPDGTYRLRNVPAGKRTIYVQDRYQHVSRSSGVEVEVEVGAAPADADDLTIDPNVRPSTAMCIRLVSQDGRPAIGEYATIHISDVGCRVPMHDGYVDWVGDPNEEFAIAVPGHGVTDWSKHRSGEVCRLRGGYRVGLRLDLDAAARLPPCCALRATVSPLDEDNTRGREPALYLERKWYEDTETPLVIAHDAPIVVDSLGRYRVDLELVRWDPGQAAFVEAPIDVEPNEFEVRAGAEPTIVTVTSRFVVTPR